jgi:hypothetical protein
MSGEMMLAGMLGTGSDSGCASHWIEVRRFRFWMGGGSKRRLASCGCSSIRFSARPEDWASANSSQLAARSVHSTDNCAPAVLCHRNPKSDSTSKQQLTVITPKLATLFFIWLHISIVFL